MVIADNVAIHVNEIFVDGAPLDNIGLVWWGALAFGIQIYCDFSAYTDIAIGSALLFGIRLPENFDSPYVKKVAARFLASLAYFSIHLATRLSLHSTWKPQWT